MFTYFGKLTHVVDGDTCDIDVDLGFHVKLNMRFRLARIDTPERGQEGFSEATQGLIDVLGLIGPKLVVKCIGKDKYGRWIAEIENDNTNVSDYMLEHGFALPYEK